MAALGASLTAAHASEEAILAGDLLHVTVWNQPTLSGLFTVADDGAIVFPLLGRLDTSNLTVRGLESVLRARLADGFVLTPQVRVEIERRAGRVFVTGEVQRSGRYHLSTGMTVAEALAIAGWVTDRAGREVVVTRTASDDSSQVATIDLSDITSLSTAGLFPLADGDVVLVRAAPRVHVTGAVARPGEYVIRPGAVMAHAVSQAGGVLPEGSDEVTIVRASGTDRTELAATPHTLLEQGDVIVIATRGPWRVIRQLGLVDVGYDSNIDHTGPERRGDYVSTVRGGLDATARTARLDVDAHGQLDYLYFQRYQRQRSLNSAARLRVAVPLATLEPFAKAAYDHGLARDQFDMDRRLFRTAASGDAGAALRIGSVTSVTASVSHARIDYAPEGSTDTEDDYWLDRHEDGASLRAQTRLTAVTTGEVAALRSRARFQSAPERDGTMLAVMPGMVFGPVAALPGHVAFGYKQVRFDAPVLRPFRGMVGDLQLAPWRSERTRLTVTAERDFHYSMERISGYYTLTATGAGIEHWLGSLWRVELQGIVQWFRYDAAPGDRSRTDRGISARTRVSRRLSPTTMFAISVDAQRRRSAWQSQGFDAVMAGISVTYVH